MKAKKYVVLAVIAILSFVIFSASVKGISPWEKDQINKFGVSTLKGMTSIRPIVGILENEEPATHGLSRDELQTQVELALRNAGVNVTEKDFTYETHIGGEAVLAVGIFLRRIEVIEGVNIYAITTNMELFQYVTLVRDPKVMTFIPTWPRGYSKVPGWAESEGLRETVKEGIDRDISKFINDYLAANPKEPAIEKNQLPTKKEESSASKN